MVFLLFGLEPAHKPTVAFYMFIGKQTGLYKESGRTSVHQSYQRCNEQTCLQEAVVAGMSCVEYVRDEIGFKSFRVVRNKLLR
jgi:hypothetical protein